MNSGRSIYTFQLNCDPSTANDLIQAYIQGNGFTLQEKDGERFYRAGDAMFEGYRYFNYSINEQTLTLQAWLKSAFGVEMSIEQNSLNMPAMNYRNSLGKLFQEIEKLSNGGTNMNNNNGMNFDPNTGQPINQNMNNNNNGMNFDPNTGQPINQNNQFAQSFQNETTKKQENMCECGFWLSVVGLLASFAGLTYGLIIYVLNFYFASQGLKTRKKGKAIATIVMSIMSILIIVLQVVLS